MTRSYYIIMMASTGMKPEEGVPPLEDHELPFYYECVNELNQAKAEGRKVILYTPDDD